MAQTDWNEVVQQSLDRIEKTQELIPLFPSEYQGFISYLEQQMHFLAEARVELALSGAKK